MAYNRRRTRAENDRSGILRHQERWLGENSDEDPVKLVEGQIQLQENAVSYGSRIEPRSGTWLHSSLAGLVGTVYGKHFHKPSRRWLFHIGTHLYWADAAVTALTEITSYAASPAVFGANTSTRLHTTFRDFNEGVIVCKGNAGLHFINISDATVKWYELTSPSPLRIWNSIGSAAYMYRYYFTFSRIEDGASNTSERNAGGKVVHESGTTTVVNTFTDYAEQRPATPIAAGTPLAVDLRSFGYGETPDAIALLSSPHWNFLSVYRTMEISSNFGVSLKTGEVNDPELYVWVKDVHLGSGTDTFNDSTDDDTLRARIAGTNGASAYILQTRGWCPIGAEVRGDDTAVNATIESFEVSNLFLFATYQLNKKIVHYSQLGQSRFAGYHNPLQNKKFNDDVTAIRVNNLGAVFCHSSKMSGGDLSAYKDDGLDGSPMFILRSFYPLDQTKGIIDYSSIAEIEVNKFICVCNDKTVRMFDGTKFGDDLADKTVSKIIRSIVSEGSVGRYVKGAYILLYRDDSSATSNNKCLRFAIESKAGVGWSRFTGFIATHKYHGGALMIDASGYSKLILQDFTSSFLYWAETYDGPTGSNLYKSAKDKANLADLTAGTAIVSKLKMPDLTGELESFYVIHQMSQLHARSQKPYSASNPNYTMDANGYAAGFSINMNGYSDGVISDTLIGEQNGGDLEFYEPPQGHRITVEYVLNAAGWTIPREETRYRVIDKKSQITIHGSTDAGYYTELEKDLRLWISRGEFLDLERILAKRYAVYGVASASNPNAGFSPVIGPDLKDGSAITFNDVVGSYLWGRTTPASAWLSQILLPGDFTFSFWAKLASFSDPSLAKEGDVIGGDVDGGGYTAFNFSMTEIGIMTPFGLMGGYSVSEFTNWHHFLFVRSGNTVTLRYDQNLMNTFSGSPYAIPLRLATANTYIGGPGVSLFDVRLYDSAKPNAAFVSYRNEVILNAGNKVLPYF